MAYLLHWVMIYSFGINTDFENRSEFDTMTVNGDSILTMDKSWRHFGINTDLRIDPNLIPHPGH